MFLANLNGKATLYNSGRTLDIEKSSLGRLPSDIMQVYNRWDDFIEWASDIGADSDGWTIADSNNLECPVPNPRQSFGIGFNYRTHILETGTEIPEIPYVFTKFPSCTAGPNDIFELPTETVDWEAEVVVVIARPAFRVASESAWSVVAGVTCGQDFSERTLQRTGPGGVSLAKSYPGFGAMGPVLATPDEFSDPDSLGLSCTINGETVQTADTNDLVFSVPFLIEFISSRTALFPGDVIFTGTPSGVGGARKPPRYLRPGDEIITTVQGVGDLHSVAGAFRQS